MLELVLLVKRGSRLPLLLIFLSTPFPILVDFSCGMEEIPTEGKLLNALNLHDMQYFDKHFPYLNSPNARNIYIHKTGLYFQVCQPVTIHHAQRFACQHHAGYFLLHFLLFCRSPLSGNEKKTVILRALFIDAFDI